MKNNLPKICYWCGVNLTKESIRKEHVPPRSFFPKGYRINLMTVPSCEIHNNNFSDLDEKFQVYFKMHKTNSVAYDNLKDTVARGLRRKEKIKFIENFNRNTGFGSLNGKNHIFSKLQPYEADHFVKKIVKAIYFYHQEKPIEGKIDWNSNYIFFEGLDALSIQQHLKEFLSDRSFLIGEFSNPKVFQYEYFNIHSLFMISMNFYEGIEIIAWILPENFTYDNFDSEQHGYTEKQLEAINNRNEVVYPVLKK